MEAKQKLSLFINKDGKLLRVLPEDLICIAANRAYCDVFVAGYQRPFNLSHSMASVLRLLPDGMMENAGRSLAVNMSHVKEIGECTLMMDNGLSFTIHSKAMRSLRENIVILV